MRLARDGPQSLESLPPLVQRRPGAYDELSPCGRDVVSSSCEASVGGQVRNDLQGPVYLGLMIVCATRNGPLRTSDRSHKNDLVDELEQQVDKRREGMCKVKSTRRFGVL